MTSAFTPSAPTAPPPIRPEFCHAVVFDGDAETAYRRAGRGATVVVLAADGWPGEPAILDTLARAFRVIVPALAAPSRTGPDHAAVAARVSAFLDGLGTQRVAVVADPHFAPAARRLATREPDRIERLAIVLEAPDPQASGPMPGVKAGPSYRGAAEPFVALLGVDRARTARELATFLSGDPSTTD